MPSSRSGSSSQRSITTYYPSSSVNSSRRRTAIYSNSRLRDGESLSRRISLSVSRCTSRSPSISLGHNSLSSIAGSNSGSRNRGSISRPGTSQSLLRLDTSRSANRPTPCQSDTKTTNSVGNARSSTSRANTARNKSRSRTVARSTASSPRPRTSQSNAVPRSHGKTALSTLGTGSDQQIICAISESRGVSPVVGLAFVNLTTSEAVLCQISDNQTYTKTIHKLWVFDPSEILFMNTAAQSTSPLYSVVENHRHRLLPHARLVVIDRKYWSETSGQEFIQMLAFRQDVEAIKMSLGGSFYAICCFAAVGGRRQPFSIFQTESLSRCSSILIFTCHFLSPFILFESNMSHLKAR